jgi:hypothetical protein
VFSLIIVIVSIALVAALALATIYYGGTAFNIGGDRAAATRAISEGNQISGALKLYLADNGRFPVGTSEAIGARLVAEGYLRSMPTGTPWEFRNDYTVRTGLTLEQCERVNSDLGIPNPPPLCTDPAATGRTLCCATP